MVERRQKKKERRENIKQEIAKNHKMYKERLAIDYKSVRIVPDLD